MVENGPLNLAQKMVYGHEEGYPTRHYQPIETLSWGGDTNLSLEKWLPAHHTYPPDLTEEAVHTMEEHRLTDQITRIPMKQNSEEAWIRQSSLNEVNIPDPQSQDKGNRSEEVSGSKTTADYVSREDTTNNTLRNAANIRYQPIPNGGDHTVIIRAITAQEAMGQLGKEPTSNNRDDQRIKSSDRQHDEISWASCVTHQCASHLHEKVKNNTFPIRTEGMPATRPYLAMDLPHWVTTQHYRRHQVAFLEQDHHYPGQCQWNNESFWHCRIADCEIHKDDKLHEYTQLQKYCGCLFSQVWNAVMTEAWKADLPNKRHLQDGKLRRGLNTAFCEHHMEGQREGGKPST
jgi:hypothetical protein